MDRASVTSGAAFATALRGTGVLVCILLVTGSIGYGVLQRQLTTELQAQIEQDRSVLQETFEGRGTAGLIDTITALHHPFHSNLHLFALFDARGKRLAGELAAPPTAMGWSRAIPALTAPRPLSSEEFLLQSKALGDMTLVIGRSLAIVTAAERQLIMVLVAMGGVIGAAFLLLGYRASQHSFRKLHQMARVLDRVSQGENEVRLQISPQNDQIDRVARAMNLHLDRLSNLMATTRASAAAIAHDLRTPLSRAFLALDQVQLRLDHGQDAQAALDTAAEELTRLRTIFDVILRISRLEQATPRAGLPNIAVDQVLRDLAETFTPLAEEKGQTLSLTLPDTPLLCPAEAPMLSQLMANLLQNAITHCPEGAQIAFGAGMDQGALRLWVTDSGLGIPLGERDKVFALFYSLDPNRTKGGNGLGLALVRAICEQMGAKVALSDANPGLRVDITFAAPSA